MLHSLPDLLGEGETRDTADNVVYAMDEGKRVNQGDEPCLGQVGQSAQPSLLAHSDLDAPLHATNPQGQRTLGPAPIPLSRGDLDQNLVTRPHALGHQAPLVELEDQDVGQGLRADLTSVDSLFHTPPGNKYTPEMVERKSFCFLPNSCYTILVSGEKRHPVMDPLGLDSLSPLFADLTLALGWVGAQVLLLFQPLLTGWVSESAIEQAIRCLEAPSQRTEGRE